MTRARAFHGSAHRSAACIIWITGLPGSGKTTIAKALKDSLLGDGKQCILLDGDVLRTGISRDLGYSQEDRSEHARRTGEIAALFSRIGVITIVALISPIARDRKIAKQACASSTFFEIYLDVPLEICEQRDPKGLYKKARRGKILNFTGIDAAYEAPRRPDLRLQTHVLSVRDCTDKIRALIAKPLRASRLVKASTPSTPRD
jgi:adenylylsulfate kinase